MIGSCIDIGSNSILLLAGTYDQNNIFHSEINECEVTGLGKQIDQTQIFSQASMDATLGALKNFREILIKRNIDPQATIVTATEASRIVKNSREFFQQIKQELGFEVTIISSQGEAYYSALGVWSGLENDQTDELFIMDLGGASTEIIKVKTNPFAVADYISLPIGSVRATDWIAQKQFDQKFKKMIEENQKKLDQLKSKTLICIAGTMTTLAAVLKGLDCYHDSEVHGHSFERNHLLKSLKLFSQYNSDQLLAKFPIIGKRASTFFAGSKVAFELGQYLDVENYQISVYGLRYGTLFEGKVKDEFIIR